MIIKGGKLGAASRRGKREGREKGAGGEYN
jgi:hypothetical protein